MRPVAAVDLAVPGVVALVGVGMADAAVTADRAVPPTTINRAVHNGPIVPSNFVFQATPLSFTSTTRSSVSSAG